MKRILSLSFVIVVACAGSSVFAQNTPTPGAPAGAGTPAGGGDKNFADDLRKMNSIELERIKREAEKSGSKTTAPGAKPKTETKFAEIKEDFENIQIDESAIIKAYTTGQKIDYRLIETSANEIVKKSRRLDGNLFPAKIEAEKEDPNAKKTETQTPEPKTPSIRDLIVNLDAALGEFVTSKIFQTPKVVDPEAEIKARKDLANVMKLAETLVAESKKMP